MRRLLNALLIVLAFATFAYAAGAVSTGNTVVTTMYTHYDNTTDMNSTDTSQLFTTAFSAAHNARYGSAISADTWLKIKAVWITVENADIRVAFGTSASQGTTTGKGHVVASGASLRIPDPKKITSMRFISRTASTPAHIQASLEY